MRTRTCMLSCLAFLLAVSAASAQSVGFRTHPEDPWGPLYFRVMAPPDSDWIPIFALRHVMCIPPDFVLNNEIDPTPGQPPYLLRAHSCPLAVTGYSIYADGADPDPMKPPMFTYLEGKNSVVLYLLPNSAVFVSPGRARPLTLKYILELKEKFVGVATEYVEKISPTPGPTGGGGKLPWIEITAKGKFLDGRSFRYKAGGMTRPDNPAAFILTTFEFAVD